MTAETKLSKADTIALAYVDYLKTRGLELPAYDLCIVGGFVNWLVRHYDIYKLDEVNCG